MGGTIGWGSVPAGLNNKRGNYLKELLNAGAG